VVNGKPKKPAPPPKTLFNLEEDWSVKTVHHHLRQVATAVGSTPPRKGKGKIVKVASSGEESASSSRKDGLCTAAAIGDEDSPTSSGKDDSKDPSRAYGG
jgi:hypothetical protein